MALEAATIALIAYLSASLILLLILSIISYVTSPWKGTTKFIRAVWSWRSIYGLTLVHLYDTSTDIAILLIWGKLTRNEVSGQKDYENVDMLSFFVPAVVFIFLYRISYAVYHWSIFRDSNNFSRIDIVLILLDLYVFKIVYQQFKGQYLSPCAMQKKMQLLESVFESMPQLILQTIFLIRTYGTELAESDSIWIVFASIIASLLSVVTKFVDEDTCIVNEEAQKLHCKPNRCPCFSMSYAAILIWRLCETVTRFCIFTLLWSVVGGLFFIIYLCLSVFAYFCLDKYTDYVWIYGQRGKQIDNEYSKSMLMLLTVLQSIAGIPLRDHILMNILRFCEHCCIFALICTFAFVRFDCYFCYDKVNRNINENEYIQSLLISSAITMAFTLIIYFIIWYIDIITVYKLKEVQFADDVKKKYTKMRIKSMAISPIFQPSAPDKMMTTVGSVSPSAVSSDSPNSTEFGIPLKIEQFVPLKVHSFNGWYHKDYHPRNLFVDTHRGTDLCYKSKEVHGPEEDWIIFEIDNDASYKYQPRLLKIKNNIGDSAIKQIKLYFQYSDSAEWKKWQTVPNIHNNDASAQWFDLVSTYKSGKTLHLIKVVVEENHGDDVYNSFCLFSLFEGNDEEKRKKGKENSLATQAESRNVVKTGPNFDVVEYLDKP